MQFVRTRDSYIRTSIINELYVTKIKKRRKKGIVSLYCIKAIVSTDQDQDSSYDYDSDSYYDEDYTLYVDDKCYFKSSSKARKTLAKFVKYTLNQQDLKEQISELERLIYFLPSNGGGPGFRQVSDDFKKKSESYGK